MRSSKNIAIVILAAGSSTRMGDIKQLLPWKNTCLLAYVLQQAKKCSAKKCYVVLGSNAARISSSSAMDLYKVQVIYNDQWGKGLGSSIASAVNFLEKEKSDFDGILIALGDQPLLSFEHFNALIKRFEDGKHSIITTGYAKKSGVPALFGWQYADELRNLNQDHGAQKIIQKYPHEVAKIQVDMETLDIDTPEHYAEAFRKFGQP